MTTNIIIAGVGGQGLVLATRIISEVAFRAGYDVKTSDIIGLSQRGGKVWGVVKFGNRVYSADVPKGQGDVLVGFEALETLRWIPYLKPGARVIQNNQEVFPNRVLIEKEEYPNELIESIIKLDIHLDLVEGEKIAEELGNEKLVNTVVLGRLARYLPFGIDVWVEVLKEFVPARTIELNLKAFQKGNFLYSSSLIKERIV